MNKFMKPSYLPVLTLLGGLLGLILRAWLVLAGTDEKGLLVTTHPAHILVFVLTALVLAAIFLCVRPLGALKRYQDLFPNGILPGNPLHTYDVTKKLLFHHRNNNHKTIHLLFR